MARLALVPSLLMVDYLFYFLSSDASSLEILTVFVLSDNLVLEDMDLLKVSLSAL